MVSMNQHKGSVDLYSTIPITATSAFYHCHHPGLAMHTAKNFQWHTD